MLNRNWTKVLIIFLITLLLPGCSGSFEYSPLIYENSLQVINMSDEQLLEEVYKLNRFAILDFTLPDDFGVSLLDGEMWDSYLGGSASTIEEAEKLVDTYSKSWTNPLAIEYIGENKLLLSI